MSFFVRTLAAVDRLDQTDMEDFASFMDPDQAEAFLSEVTTIRNSK